MHLFAIQIRKIITSIVKYDEILKRFYDLKTVIIPVLRILQKADI